MVMMLGNPSFTTPDYKGNTALHYACSLGHVALVRWLVDHGANLEARTEKGASIDACVGGGKNGEAIKGILQQARRERDYPLRGPQASEEEAARAVAWLEKAFRCEDVNSPLYELPSPDATAQEHAETLFLYVRQNREIPPQVDVTEPLGNLLTWLRDANVHRGMFTEALQKELYQIRSYNLHQLQKAGKYNIQVCLGTACYLRGGDDIIKEFERQLGVGVNATTPDGLFSIEAVRCIGCCGLAPAVVINGEVHGKVVTGDVTRILNIYRERG